MSDEDLDGCLVGGRLEYVYCMKPYRVEWNKRSNKNMLGVCCFSWLRLGVVLPWRKVIPTYSPFFPLSFSWIIGLICT